MLPKVPIEISARHIHVSESALKCLFGEKYKLNFKRDLSQPGQFLSKEKVDLIVGSFYIENISILGPLREVCQVEISLTDAIKLKIKIDIRESGDLKDSPGFVLRGPVGSFNQNYGLISAQRHIHMNFEDAKRFGIYNNKKICELKIESPKRPLIFGNFIIRIDENFKLAAHIDTDEANAAGLQNINNYGEICI